MSQSLKAALFSAFVFPGSGHLAEISSYKVCNIGDNYYAFVKEISKIDYATIPS
jgi:hypothetical protein